MDTREMLPYAASFAAFLLACVGQQWLEKIRAVGFGKECLPGQRELFCTFLAGCAKLPELRWW